MSETQSIALFKAYGVEIEYMIVDAETLDVKPIADELIRAVCGAYESEIECGAACWSNELMAHVIEIKTNGPVASLTGVADLFHANVQRMNQILRPMGARLMPAAMHPWMNPLTEAKLWPHEYSVVFEAFDRIFGCKGHGWANLQSTHLNLPFADDEEFARLHAAIRIVLPLLPALAASSPIADGAAKPWLDYRMEVYRGNAQRVPSISGAIVPEAVFSRADYEKEILQTIYRDLEPLDPGGVLREEWVNARGAIARFMRNTIEVRVIDAQECPRADLAIAAMAAETIRGLCEGRWIPLDVQRGVSTEMLAALLERTVRHADEAILGEAYAALWGVPADAAARGVWGLLHARIEREAAPEMRETLRPVETMIYRGPLARRILRALDGDFSRPALARVYRQLCDALENNTLFLPAL